MDAELTLEGVRRRIKFIEARLRKPLSGAATSAEIAVLITLQKDEERLLKLIRDRDHGA